MNVMTLALLLLATVVAAEAEPLRPTATPLREAGRLPERLLHVRRLLHSAQQGQPAGGAQAAGGELPLRLVWIGRGLREAQSLSGPPVRQGAPSSPRPRRGPVRAP